MVDFEITQGRPENARAIQELIQASSYEMYLMCGYTKDDIVAKFKGEPSNTAVTYLAESITKNSSADIYLIAKAGGKLIGVCYAEILPNLNILHAMYVAPEHKGSGVGHALWSALQPYLNKENSIHLTVLTKNERAKKFYTKLGFRDTGKRSVDPNFTSQSGKELEEMEMVLEGTIRQ